MTKTKTKRKLELAEKKEQTTTKEEEYKCELCQKTTINGLIKIRRVNPDTLSAGGKRLFQLIDSCVDCKNALDADDDKEMVDYRNRKSGSIYQIREYMETHRDYCDDCNSFFGPRCPYRIINQCDNCISLREFGYVKCYYCKEMKTGSKMCMKTSSERVHEIKQLCTNCQIVHRECIRCPDREPNTCERIMNEVGSFCCDAVLVVSLAIIGVIGGLAVIKLCSGM